MVNDVAPQRKALLNQKNGILERQLARGTNIPSRQANAPGVERLPRWNFPEWFIIAQTLLPGLVHGPRHLARLLVLLFICNGVNSCVGILQVYNPEVWMPEEFSPQVTSNRYGLDAVSYIGPDGKRIIRPAGLFDAPGAVCGPAMVTALLGLIFCLAPGPLRNKALAAILGLAGMAAIYLSHVRS